VLPQGGGWGAWLSGYGARLAPVQRPVESNGVGLSIARTKLAPNGKQGRAGDRIWPLSDESGGPAPSSTPSAFNTLFRNDSARCAVHDRRNVSFGASPMPRRRSRPDYFYSANVLYSDTVTPARIGIGAGRPHAWSGLQSGAAAMWGGASGIVFSWGQRSARIVATTVQTARPRSA